MDVFEAIQARRSIRKYTDAPVPLPSLERVLEAGRLAPSWKNWQCWKYILVSDKELLAKLGSIMEGNPAAKAFYVVPYALVLCADPSKSGDDGGKQYYMADAGISMDHVMLAAAGEGLGTCFIGWFDEAKVKEALNVPEGIRIVGLTPLGVPEFQPKPRPRQAVEEMVYENGWKSRS